MIMPRKFMTMPENAFIYGKLMVSQKQGPIFDMYKRAKTKCKYATRYINRNANRLQRNAIAKKYRGLNKQEF